MKTESRTSETHLNIETLVATHSAQVSIAKKALTVGMRVCQETHDVVMGMIRKDPYVDVEEEHREKGCGGREGPLLCTYVFVCRCVRVMVCQAVSGGVGCVLYASDIKSGSNQECHLGNISSSVSPLPPSESRRYYQLKPFIDAVNACRENKGVRAGRGNRLKTD